MTEEKKVVTLQFAKQTSTTFNPDSQKKTKGQPGISLQLRVRRAEGVEEKRRTASTNVLAASPQLR